jgi:protein phosphatase
LAADTNMSVAWAVVSDTGLRRSSNEDNHCARPDLGLFLVADGMGGHVAGEVASRIAVETIEEFVDQTKAAGPDDTLPFPFDTALSTDANRMTAAFRLANRTIAAKMAAAQGLRGMATTASAVLVYGEKAVVAHVGDSRVYRFRGGELERLTVDHSWVEEQVRAGALTPEAARQHPWRNVVTRALSGGDDPVVDVAEYPLKSGDRLLLCSDGLFSVTPDEKTAEILGRDAPLADICQALVDEANAKGGPDNITTLVLQIDVP